MLDLIERWRLALERKEAQNRYAIAKKVNAERGIQWKALKLDIKRGYAPSDEWVDEFVGNAWANDCPLGHMLAYCLKGGHSGLAVVQEAMFPSSKLISAQRVDRSGPAWLIKVDLYGVGEHIVTKLVCGDVEFPTAVVRALVSIKVDMQEGGIEWTDSKFA